MALVKTKTLENGFEAEYWKVLETNINYLNKNSHVTIGLYKDKQARIDGKRPVETQSFDWAGDNFPFTVGAMEQENVIAISYEKIKEPKLETVVIPGIDGEPDTEEQRDSNFFSDAVDD